MTTVLDPQEHDVRSFSRTSSPTIEVDGVVTVDEGGNKSSCTVLLPAAWSAKTGHLPVNDLVRPLWR
jgi:hypothetical protein